MMERLWRMLAPPQGDLRTILCVFAYAFGTASSYVIHRSTGNSLFLVHIGVEYLPLMYMVSALLVVFCSFIYAAAVRRWRLDQVIRGTLLLSATTVLGLRLLFVQGDPSTWLILIFVIANEIRGNMNTVQFATLVNELFADSDPKQVFAFLGAGATLAGVVFGTLLGVFVDSLGTSNALFLIVAIDLATMIPIALLARKTRYRRMLAGGNAPEGAGAVTRRPLAGLRVALRSPLARNVAILVCLSVMVNLLIEYEWQLAAATAYPGDADSLTSFFAFYYAVVYVTIGGMQIFFTGWFLRRFGMIFGLLTHPTALLATLGFNLLATGGASVLWAVTLVKGCEIFKRTINDPVLQLLYWPLDSVARRQAIAFTSGVVKPVSEATGALLLFELRQYLTGPQIVYAAAVLVGCWIAAALRCRVQYVRTLNDALREGNPSAWQLEKTPGEATYRYLETALTAQDPLRIEHTLELLQSLRNPARCGPHALVHLYSPSARVRKRVIDFLATTDDRRYAPHIKQLFHDRDREVQLAAVRAYCRLLRSESLPVVRVLLNDISPEVVATVLTSLHRWTGIELDKADWVDLDALLIHSSPALRRAAVELLTLGGQSRIPAWRQLLDDPDPQVSLAAIRSAGAIRKRELIPLLVERLKSPITATAATQALANFGPMCLAAAQTVLDDLGSSANWRREVMRLVRLIRDPAALTMAVRTLNDEDEGVIGEALYTIHKLVRDERLPLTEREAERLKEAYRRELLHFYERMTDLVDIEARMPDTLLVEALDKLREECADHVLLCLAVLQPNWDFDSMTFSLKSHGTRRKLLGQELLSNSVAGELAPAVMAMVSDRTHADLAATGREFFGLANWSPEERLRRLIYDRNDWVKTTTLLAVRQQRLVHLADDVEGALSDQEFIVRETAVVTLAALVDHAALVVAISPLLADPDPRLRALVQSYIDGEPANGVRPIRPTNPTSDLSPVRPTEEPHDQDGEQTPAEATEHMTADATDDVTDRSIEDLSEGSTAVGEGQGR